MEFDIKHDADKNRFYAVISGKICDLKYKTLDNKTLEYYSTYVPEEFRGQGIAGKITSFALEYAKSHQYVVMPTCPYVKQYIETHSEYQQIMKRA